MSTNPRTVDEVFKDFKGRRSGMLKALTTGRLSLRAVCEQTDERLCVALFPRGLPCKGPVSCVKLVRTLVAMWNEVLVLRRQFANNGVMRVPSW